MDYEASENSKEASKEKWSSRNTIPNFLNGMTILKIVYALLQSLDIMLINSCWLIKPMEISLGVGF